MTAKKFLSRPYWIDRRIDKKQEEIDRLRARLTKATANLSGMPRGGSGGDWTDADIKVLEMENAIHAEIIELCRVKRDVNELIDSVEEERLRTLLELRYRNYLSFEQVAVEMGYSYEWVRHLHKKALAVVGAKLDTQKHTEL